MKFAAAIGEELGTLTLLGADAPRSARTRLPKPVVQVPAALLEPAVGDNPSRWGSKAPSYVAAGEHAAVPAWVAPPSAASAVDPPPGLPSPAHRPLSGFAATVPVSAAPATPAMPFAARAASSAETLPHVVARAPTAQEGSGTVAVGNEVAAPPLPPGIADLTLQQYASLRVELHVRPDCAAASLDRYGVSAESGERLDAYWRARFEADPLLRMTFAQAYAKYLEWLKANPGS
jgi:hypothetical protein